ncbi:hypothetical protein V501_05780 [Pseudogymnoascus sp. VKM F-4519 (FW-2642)]|nr:hypothetical protein V501_05780 [Pseudogymnoascus sp. VKM F-4519 (FW-2642)]
MEQRRPPEYILEVFADPSSVKDVVKGILHTIFFHRFFPSVRPRTHDVLDLTLPVVGDAELETLIEQKTSSLIRQLDTTSDLGSRSSGVRGQIAVQFFEKRRRKAWFTKGEEEVCWEQWTLDVTLAIPRTESGEASKGSEGDGDDAAEDSHEDRDYGKPRERPYPPDHHE